MFSARASPSSSLRYSIERSRFVTATVEPSAISLAAFVISLSVLALRFRLSSLRSCGVLERRAERTGPRMEPATARIKVTIIKVQSIRAKPAPHNMHRYPLRLGARDALRPVDFYGQREGGRS